MNIYAGLALAGAYIVTFIGLAEWLHRQRGVPATYTRKLIHIGVGMLVWLVPFLFDSPWPFVGAALFFAVFNWLEWRNGLLAGMASGDRGNLGTIYFPLVAAAVALLLWSRPALMVAALMPLTWGDGLAPLAGRLWGKHFYSVLGARRSREGSRAFFIAAALAVWAALALFPDASALPPLPALATAVVIAGATALAEGLTPWGLDNLTVTAVATGLLLGLPF